MSINRVVISGNLTRDPELRATSSGTSVLKGGIAVNERSGQKPNTVRMMPHGELLALGQCKLIRVQTTDETDFFEREITGIFDITETVNTLMHVLGAGRVVMICWHHGSTTPGPSECHILDPDECVIAEAYREAKAEADKWRRAADVLASDGGLWSADGAAMRLSAAVREAEWKRGERS